MTKSLKVCALLAIVLLVTICQHQPVSSVSLVKLSTPSSSYKDRVIGCLFADVCDSTQICFDDNAFGRCEEWNIRTGSVASNYVHRLDRKTLQLLETELNRLNEQEYTWTDKYTQCILKAVLNDRPRTVYRPERCEQFSRHESFHSQTRQAEDNNPFGSAIERFVDQQRTQKSQSIPKQSKFSVSPYSLLNTETLKTENDNKEHNTDLNRFFNLPLSDDDSELPANENDDYLGEWQQIEEPANDVDPSLVYKRSLLSRLNGDRAETSDTNDADNNADFWDEPNVRTLRGINTDALDDNQGLAIIEADDDDNTNEENDNLPVIVVDKVGDTLVLQQLLEGNQNGEDDEGGQDNKQDALKEIPLEDINYSNNVDEDESVNFNRMHRYDIKKPGPRYMEEYFFENTSSQNNNNNNNEKDNEQFDTNQAFVRQTKEYGNANTEGDDNPINLVSSKAVAEGPVKVDGKLKNILIVRSANKGEKTNLEAIDSSHTYLVTDRVLGEGEAQKFVQTLEQLFKLPRGSFSNSRNDGKQLTFKVNPNFRELNASQVASRIEELSTRIFNITGFSIRESGIGNKARLALISPSIVRQKNKAFLSLTLTTCSVVLAFILAALVIFMCQRKACLRQKIKMLAESVFKFDYEQLYRNDKTTDDGKDGKLKHVDTNLANQNGSGQEVQKSPPSRSSTSSWALEEPVSSNMDITTGHIILSYMEDHLKKKNRLEKEWESLCAYEADPCSTNAALQKQNVNKNRYADILPFDHSRMILDDLNNASNSDYINASAITDHDPKNPVYIATQGPLANTKADFWQMVWEQGSVIIVMLTRLRENGLNMCERYWPEEGSERHHNYEVHLVSEHIWCDDYLVRSFYLKNLKTGETRTVTQFHFLSWPDNEVPPNVKSILDFRRKINKSYKGRSCPIVVHCNDGIGRTGVYLLIDMVINRIAKGTKEIDIAATLEHIRDQRMGMVKTKAQLEFVLLAVAEEVQAILKTLSQTS